jgi:hypothetical protein
MILRFTLPLIAAACFAQAPADLFSRAPKGVDEALRARITQFYHDHMDAKYRQAEKLVAEDSKDFFYAANKPKYLGFEIQKIEYSEDFTKAKAMILVEQYVLMPGLSDKPMKVPIPSRWKIVDGQWYWYVDQDELRKTPFGSLASAPGSESGTAAKMPHIPSADEMTGIFRQVKADKSKVELEVGGSVEVLLTNQAQGVMTVALFNKLAGLQAKLDRSQLKAGEKAVLTLTAIEKPNGTLQLRVDQTNQIIPIEVVTR